MRQLSLPEFEALDFVPLTMWNVYNRTIEHLPRIKNVIEDF